MYDITQKRSFRNARVSDLMKALEALPPDAQIVCDGDEWFWLHVEEDGSVANIDSSELDTEYEPHEETREQMHTVKFYTIIRSGIDIDRGSFPTPSVEGCCYDAAYARKRLKELVAAEKERLGDRYTKIEEDADSWEAYNGDEPTALFSRLEVVESELLSV